MILKIEDVKKVCSKLLYAVDSDGLSIVTELIELKASNNSLEMSVTNKEYFVKTVIPIESDEEFHATVSAVLFLKLISQFTTKDIELTVEDTSLVVNGNGTYRIPLVFDGEELFVLPSIKVENPTTSFKIPTSVLENMLMYNMKEAVKGLMPIQKLFYVDENGCITFNTSACVTSFNLESPIKMLLSQKVVKLFKLFESEEVNFDYEEQEVSNGVIQSKVKFYNDEVELSSILLTDETLLNSCPVEAIRKRADNEYEHSISVSKDDLLQAIQRLLIFTPSKDIVKAYSNFVFENSGVSIYDRKKENREIISYIEDVDDLSTPYEAILDLNDLKYSLENCKGDHITLNFGNHQAFVLQRYNVKNIIPECKL